MPITFEDRERAFEAKFVHDEDQRFRVAARRDKLFAAWLATQRKLSRADAEVLRQAFLAVPGGPGHDAALLALAAAGQAQRSGEMTHDAMAAALRDCATQAAEQVSHDVNWTLQG